MSKRTFEEIERQLAESGWHEALNDAYRYKTTKLSAYLRRSDLPLDQDKREQLADLIDRRIHRKAGSGRKPGRIPPRDPDEVSEDQIAAAARRKVQSMKQRNDGRTPRGAYLEAIHEVCQYFADNGFSFHIDKENVLAKMRRGRRRK